MSATHQGATSTARHVAVLGAGIEGACSAIELLRAGHRVTIVEPGEPGGEQASSFGNAGWFSSMSVIPPIGPGTWRSIPGILADPLGPLALRWAYLPQATPWLLRSLLAGFTEPRIRRTAQALRPLLKDSPVLHQGLAAEAGVPDLVEHRGVLYAYPTRAAFEAEAMAWRIRREVGVTWTELDEPALRAAEPDLGPDYRFAVRVEEAGRCFDPGRYVAALVALAVARGAVLRKAAATGLTIEGGRLKGVVLADGGMLACDGAVVSCGARSKALAAAAGDKVPLETERGYHVMLRGLNSGPRNSMNLSTAKMIVSPMRAGVRAAGQVEIAGLQAAPNWKRAEILKDHLLRAFPGLPRDLPPDSVTTWMGHRPSMPDGMPCLGPSRATPDVVLAFGHGHVGMVGGPRTGRVVAQLLSGQAPEIPIEPFSPRRF